MAAPWQPKWHRSGLGDTSEGTSNITSTVRCHLRCCEVSVEASDRSYSDALVAPLGVPMASQRGQMQFLRALRQIFVWEGGEDGTVVLQCADDALGWLWECVFTSGIYSRG